MFAILFAEENLDKILEHNDSAVMLNGVEPVYADPYLNHKDNWYYVSGYVTSRGEVVPFAVLPQQVFDKKFEYDATEIKTDWNQIVRKD